MTSGDVFSLQNAGTANKGHLVVFKIYSVVLPLNGLRRLSGAVGAGLMSDRNKDVVELNAARFT